MKIHATVKDRTYTIAHNGNELVLPIPVNRTILRDEELAYVANFATNKEKQQLWSIYKRLLAHINSPLSLDIRVGNNLPALDLREAENEWGQTLKELGLELVTKCSGLTRKWALTQEIPDEILETTDNIPPHWVAARTFTRSDYRDALETIALCKLLLPIVANYTKSTNKQLAYEFFKDIIPHIPAAEKMGWYITSANTDEEVLLEQYQCNSVVLPLILLSGVLLTGCKIQLEPNDGRAITRISSMLKNSVRPRTNKLIKRAPAGTDASGGLSVYQAFAGGLLTDTQYMCLIRDSRPDVISKVYGIPAKDIEGLNKFSLSSMSESKKARVCAVANMVTNGYLPTIIYTIDSHELLPLYNLAYLYIERNFDFDGDRSLLEFMETEEYNNPNNAEVNAAIRGATNKYLRAYGKTEGKHIIGLCAGTGLNATTVLYQWFTVFAQINNLEEL